MTRIRIALAVPLAALAFAGCGGDDAPSKEEFAEAADKVCADLEKQTQNLGRPENVEEIQTFAQELRKTAEDAVSKVEDLEVPEGDDGEKAEQWKNAVKDEAENQLLPAVEELEKAAEANDEKAIVEAAQKIDQLEATESDRLAKELGLKECGESSA
ncbi:MAG: hypothetical protein M3320_09740 [Actinomycetota bacterium]|nr:hypothetical protein [Actinomycetota bacterium]MDQ5808946.1 hypothetical protein [Actinomycetota bacterium]